MDVNQPGAPMRGLYRYVTLITREISQHPSAFCYENGKRIEIYLPLSRRLSRYPDRDAALLWDEENGWSIGIESGCGEDLVIMAYLSYDILPPPAVVAAFVSTFDDSGTDISQCELPAFRKANDDDDLHQRLTAYAAEQPADGCDFLASRLLSFHGVDQFDDDQPQPFVPACRQFSLLTSEDHLPAGAPVGDDGEAHASVAGRARDDSERLPP